jgi:hypothetical protein
VVRPRDDLRPEDVQPRHAERAGELVKEARAVPRHDVDDRQRPVEVVLPVDDRAQRPDRVGRRYRLQELVHHLDVERDLAPVREDEIAVGKEAEMGRDLVVAYPGDAPGYKFLLGHLALFLMTGVDRSPEPQALKGVSIKGSMEGVLVAVPKVR